MKRFGCLLLVVMALTMWSASDAGAVMLPGQSAGDDLSDDSLPLIGDPIGLSGSGEGDGEGDGDGEWIGGNRVREELILDLMGSNPLADDVDEAIWKLINLLRTLLVLGEL